jgi:hypothetical protein
MADWREVMGAVAKQALGAKAMRQLTQPKRETRQRRTSVRHSASGADRHEQIRRNYVEALELTNPGDGFEAADDEDDSDADEDDFDDEESSSSDSESGGGGGGGGGASGKRKVADKKQIAKQAAASRRKRARGKKSAATVKKTKKTHKQRFKSLAQAVTDHYTVGSGGDGAAALAAAAAAEAGVFVPDYLGAAAAPDGLPPRRFCYVTGQPGRYRDASTGMAYSSVRAIRLLQEHPPSWARFANHSPHLDAMEELRKHLQGDQ